MCPSHFEDDTDLEGEVKGPHIGYQKHMGVQGDSGSGLKSIVQPVSIEIESIEG